jgi:TPR repeat protein
MLRVVLVLSVLMSAIFAEFLAKGVTEYRQGNKTEAIKLFAQGCDKGETQACANLGVMYDLGEGTERDVAKAYELYDLTCSQGVAKSCFNLGVAYEFGKSIRVDTTKARRYYDTSCDLGHKKGCYNLGFLDGKLENEKIAKELINNVKNRVQTLFSNRGVCESIDY